MQLLSVRFVITKNIVLIEERLSVPKYTFRSATFSLLFEYKGPGDLCTLPIPPLVHAHIYRHNAL